MPLKRKKKPVEPDLFSVAARQTERQTDPEPLSAFVSQPEGADPSSQMIRECEIADDQGEIQRYRILSHGSYCQMFVWDRDDWRQIRLGQTVVIDGKERYSPYRPGDASYIPAQLMRLSEDMLYWAAGYSQRTRDLCTRLRPPARDENIAL